MSSHNIGICIWDTNLKDFERFKEFRYEVEKINQKIFKGTLIRSKMQYQIKKFIAYLKKMT